MAGAQPFVWVPDPTALTLAPHTLTLALPPLTGADAVDGPGDAEPELDPLVWELGAQPFVWPALPPTLALTPHTVTLGLAAFTGAETSAFPPPLLALELWLEGAHC